VSPRKVWAIAAKELRQASRDPLSLMMLLGVPTMMLVLYGYAINFDVRHVPLAVRDLDQSRESRDLVAAFVNSTYFDLAASVGANADLDALTQRRAAKAVLAIPEGFSRRLAERRRVSVQLLVDGADANTATTLIGYASSIVSEANVDLQAEVAGRPLEAAVSFEPRVFYNPELQSTQFLVPGLIGFILMLTAVLSTALAVVREKERGTMEQLRVTSLKPGELIAGKMLPYLLISLLATVLILAAARILFGVAVRGPYLSLFVATFIYLIGALGFGLLVSTVVETQAVAFQVGMVTSMLPAIFLSGFIFPIRSMPLALQAITYAVPTRYFNVILRGVILKGANLLVYWQDVAFLILYAAVVMGIAYSRLTKQEA
jgi:ABC-2 type transport system permease protein